MNHPSWTPLLLLPLLLAGCKEKPLSKKEQAPGPPGFSSSGATVDAKQERVEALSFLAILRSQCDNTAWVLWRSNDYSEWRKGETQVLSLNYSYTNFTSVPAGPSTMPAELRKRWEEIVPAAIGNERLAGPAFEQLATYINAKDYEDDQFSKGDGINAKLLDCGKKAHDFSKAVEELHADCSEAALADFAKDPAKAALARRLGGDWQVARELVAELSRGSSVDRAKVEELVARATRIAEEGIAGFPEASAGNADAITEFYKEGFNDRLAVPMRKMLRETKDDPKKWAQEMEGRPRSFLMSQRGDVYIGLARDALACLER